MSIRTPGASLRPLSSLLRQAELQQPVAGSRAPLATLDRFDAAPRSVRRALLGGNDGPINVGPVFGDAPLPPANGIIRPTGPNVGAPGVVAPVQDNTLAPKIPETDGPPVQNNQPPTQNTRPPMQNTEPPVQNNQPPVQNAAPPGRNEANAPVPGTNGAPPAGAPPPSVAPGPVDPVATLPDLDARSLEELVAALVDAIEQLVSSLGDEVAQRPGESGAAAGSTPPASQPPVSFSIRASAEWVISA